jgi:hypothetical protein
MQKLVVCPTCGHTTNHSLPDVSLAEAERLKAGDDRREVKFLCFKCQQWSRLLYRDLPSLPDPPP